MQVMDTPAPHAADEELEALPGEASEFDRSVSQTLSRGLQVLEVLADAGQPMSAQQIARRLGLSRPVVYRLLRTLAAHRLLSTDAGAGLYDLGLGLLNLSRHVQKNLRQAAFPALKQLAHDLDATAVLGLRDGDDVVYALSVEPEFARAAVRSREGARRPLESSTSGLAIRMSHPPNPGDDAELVTARERGYAARTTTIAGYPATALAAPIPSQAGPSDACVTVLFPNVIDDVDVRGSRVAEVARSIAELVRI
jgi:DNA-binding IclR family transcriptional regulator